MHDSTERTKIFTQSRNTKAQYFSLVLSRFFATLRLGVRNDLFSDESIMGSFDLFPTWYPEERTQGAAQDGTREGQWGGPLFVGNLDYLFEQTGGQFPYDVWLKTDPDVDYDELVKGIRAMRVRVEEWDAPLLKISKDNKKAPLSMDQMLDFYRSIDFYLCASWNEGTPNPGLEAGACGVPVVSTRVGNMRELIKDGTNGYFVEPTVESIVDCFNNIRHRPDSKTIKSV